MFPIRQVQRKRKRAGQSGKKRKFIRGKREGDWLLRKISILPFWWSLSYTSPMENSLKEWSCNWKSGIWWSHSSEKIGASEKKACHLGSLVGLMDHCDFILCLRGQHNEPSSQWDPMWALRFQPFWFRIRVKVQSSVTTSCRTRVSWGWDKKRLECGSRGFVWG